VFGVIMAGGVGTRFWPRSREKHPKQLLNILGEQSLIQNTVNRLTPLIDKENIFVVSTQSQKDAIKSHLPFLDEHNYITEPKGRNTAPCIGLAAIYLEQFDPDGVMAVLPADHNIVNEEEFREILKTAEQVAYEEECLVTIGINPTYPSTGYGYIQFNRQVREINNIPVYHVKTFAEKPDLKTAERFIKSGDFLWNSGMFIWKISTILKEIEQNLPELYDGLLEIKKNLGSRREFESINNVYCKIKSISIDYGVMENTRNVRVVKGNFGWSDVGSWEEVYEYTQKDKNKIASKGSYFTIDSKNCFFDVPDKMVAAIGVDNLIVVETEDSILICDRNQAQRVKELVDILRQKKMNKYL